MGVYKGNWQKWGSRAAGRGEKEGKSELSDSGPQKVPSDPQGTAGVPVARPPALLRVLWGM